MQMQCVSILLKAGAAMTLRQLTILIHALPTLEDPEVSPRIKSIQCE